MDKILTDLSDWIKSTITNAINAQVAERNARLIGRKELSELLDVTETTFDKHYRYSEGFPRELPACKWSLPAVIAWIEKQN